VERNDGIWCSVLRYLAHKKSIFSALAVLPILAIPPGIAAVCALPEPKSPLFYQRQQA
jgi:hypothetical protein